LTPHAVPSATLTFATQTGAAVEHEMIADLQGWFGSWHAAPAAQATHAPEASQTLSVPHNAPTCLCAPVSSHVTAPPAQWALPTWQGLLGRQSSFSVQTRFQMTRLPPIIESAIVAPAQKRSGVIDEPPEKVVMTSPLMIGVHTARTPPPEPPPTTQAHGLSPAKQPIDSQLAPFRHDAGTDSRVSIS
jgi:hypothetical protein